MSTAEFNGHAVVGTMTQDEVILKVFGGERSLTEATQYCEDMIKKGNFLQFIKAECERLQQCSSEVMGINILRISAGVPVQSDLWYEIKKRKPKKNE